jgi:hypothetical protein
MKNPNNCDACGYRRRSHDDAGHCEMTYEAPAEPCMQHTERTTAEVLRMSANYFGIKS